MEPSYLHGLTLIPVWMSYHMPSNVWEEITYPFANLNGETVEVWERINNFIPHYMMFVIHAGIQVCLAPYGKRFG